MSAFQENSDIENDVGMLLVCAVTQGQGLQQPHRRENRTIARIYPSEGTYIRADRIWSVNALQGD